MPPRESATDGERLVVPADATRGPRLERGRHLILDLGGVGQCDVAVGKTCWDEETSAACGIKLEPEPVVLRPQWGRRINRDVEDRPSGAADFSPRHRGFLKVKATQRPPDLVECDAALNDVSGQVPRKQFIPIPGPSKEATLVADRLRFQDKEPNELGD